jgi:hypothetical protein
LVELLRHSRFATHRFDAPGILAVHRNTSLPRCQYSYVTQGPNYDVCSSFTSVLDKGNFRKYLPPQRQACSGSSHSDVAPDSSSLFRDLWPHIPATAWRQTGCLCPRSSGPCSLPRRYSKPRSRSRGDQFPCNFCRSMRAAVTAAISISSSKFPFTLHDTFSSHLHSRAPSRLYTTPSQHIVRSDWPDLDNLEQLVLSARRYRCNWTPAPRGETLVHCRRRTHIHTISELDRFNYLHCGIAPLITLHCQL